MTPIDTPPVDCATPGPRMIRRLTAAQYRNSIVAVFDGDRSVPDEDVLTDPAVNGFRLDADAAVIDNLDAELLMNYAERVAEWAVQNHKLSSFATCQNNDANCRSEFVKNFGRRVQREPVSDSRVQEYEQRFGNAGSFQEFAQLVMTTMLQSPYMLYRRELGVQNGNEYTLSPYEVASELAYFLTDAPPDNQLLEAAAQGRLNTKEDIDREVSRLIQTDAAKHMLERFVHGWLEMENLPNKAKAQTPEVQFNPDLAHAMLGETTRLFHDVFYTDKTVSDLLTANYTFLDDKLAALYQMGGGSQRVELAGSNRPTGILGHASFLTMHAQAEFSSPVQRGKIVRERLLCQDLPPVPADLDTNLDVATSFTTNRERYEVHSTNQVCANCHRMMDPVGFAFENYDHFGRYRAQEGGKPVDATGVLYGTPTGDVQLDGAQSLIDYLSQSEAVRSCLVRYWTYFAYGRDEWPQKQCNHDYIRREASTKNYTLRSVLDAIVHAPHFTRRVKDQ